MAITNFRGEYRWLSNFSDAKVMLDGADYSTVEHGYQAAKTLVLTEREEIRKLSTPGKARLRGQAVTIRQDWEDVKLQVMRDLLLQKFNILEYRNLLLGTGLHHLVEENTWGDTFWGVCDGQGRNHLGRILMDIRDQLQKSPLEKNTLFSN